MKLERKTIAKVIAVMFIFNLVVMGAGAWFAYQEAPPIPEEVVPARRSGGQSVRDGDRRCVPVRRMLFGIYVRMTAIRL